MPLKSDITMHYATTLKIEETKHYPATETRKEFFVTYIVIEDKDFNSSRITIHHDVPLMITPQPTIKEDLVNA